MAENAEGFNFRVQEKYFFADCFICIKAGPNNIDTSEKEGETWNDGVYKRRSIYKIKISICHVE